MSTSIITFANLGKKKNLKTPDIEPVIEVFEKSGQLEQVICQIHSGIVSKKFHSAIPPLLRYSMRILEKLSGKSFSRRTMEKLFDFFAMHLLRPATMTILHAGYFLTKTTQRARAYGSIVIDLAVSAHLSKNASLEREELPLLGFSEYEGLYMRLEREQQQVNTFDYVIALSEFVKESYVENGFPKDNIFVAVPDIDMQRFTANPTRNDSASFNALYVAHTQPLKGLHYLLSAWEAFDAPDATLTIVGGFSDMPEALKEQYIQLIQNDTRIKWIPVTQEPEKYYSEASMLIFPSLTEGFGRVTLEAMASGLPVVTTENARGIVEDGKSGFVVPIRDADALREKLEFLYHNPMIRKEMGIAARKAVVEKQPFGPRVFEICEEIRARELKKEKDI